MLERLLHALVESPNEAADDLLLEGLRVGNPAEQESILRALVRRGAVRGLSGVVELYDSLPEPLQNEILAGLRDFHHALRECGRSDRPELRLAAMNLIALGRQGKLAYVLSENLHDPDESLSKAATEAMVAMARWVATETRALQRGSNVDEAIGEPASAGGPSTETYNALVENRTEIEAAVARAMDVHRGKHGP